MSEDEKDVGDVNASGVMELAQLQPERLDTSRVSRSSSNVCL